MVKALALCSLREEAVGQLCKRHRDLGWMLFSLLCPHSRLLLLLPIDYILSSLLSFPFLIYIGSKVILASWRRSRKSTVTIMRRISLLTSPSTGGTLMESPLLLPRPPPPSLLFRSFPRIASSLPLSAGPAVSIVLVHCRLSSTASDTVTSILNSTPTMDSLSPSLRLKTSVRVSSPVRIRSVTTALKSNAKAQDSAPPPKVTFLCSFLQEPLFSTWILNR